MARKIGRGIGGIGEHIGGIGERIGGLGSSLKMNCSCSAPKDDEELPKRRQKPKPDSGEHNEGAGCAAEDGTREAAVDDSAEDASAEEQQQEDGAASERCAWQAEGNTVREGATFLDFLPEEIPSVPDDQFASCENSPVTPLSENWTDISLDECPYSEISHTLAIELYHPGALCFF